VRWPRCRMPFRAPEPEPPSVIPLGDPPVEEPPIVTLAAAADDSLVPVVRVPRPAAVVPLGAGRIATPVKRRDGNAGMWTGVVIGAAVFLLVGAVGAALVIGSMSQDRASTFQRAMRPPAFPPPFPAEKLA